MNILGMGSLEVLVVLLVAFVVLGPARMVEAGRLLGKGVREVRRLTEGLPELIVGEDQPGPRERPTVHPRGSSTVADKDDGQGAERPSDSKEPDADGEGPVSFRPSTSTETPAQAKKSEGP